MKVVNRLKTKSNEFSFDKKSAENIAVSMFRFIASEPEHFSRFADITGVEISDLAEIAGNKTFLAAVVDFLMNDESLLLSFCENNNIQPEIINKVRFALSDEQSEF